MKTKPLTIRQFFQLFPTDDACLEHVMRTRYGQRHACLKCGKSSHHYRIKARKAYECEYCGHHVYPCAGTPFEKSRTPLQFWFFAMYLFCASRSGVAAKELQRQLGVTYKCAWRMGHEIRIYMGTVDGDDPLGGFGAIVEADETFIGGKDKLGRGDEHVVLGAVERGGEIITEVIPDRREGTMIPELLKMIVPGSRVATDEHKSYRSLPSEDYAHATVNHATKEYVRGRPHEHD